MRLFTHSCRPVPRSDRSASTRRGTVGLDLQAEPAARPAAIGLALLACLSFVLATSLASAAPAPSPAPARKILLLVKDRDIAGRTQAAYIGGFLEKAGYTYAVQNVEEMLARPSDTSGYAGIVTAFLSTQMAGAEKFPSWLLDQMRARRPVAIVGTFGAYQGLQAKPDKSSVETPLSRGQLNRFFVPFGLEFDFAFTGDKNVLRTVRKEAAYSEFQAPLTPDDVNHYQLFKSVDPRNQVHLSVERTDRPASESAFVVHTPFGGMILEGYPFFWSAEKKQMVQRVDMARFLKEALARVPPEVAAFEPPPEAHLVPGASPSASASPRSFVGKVAMFYKKRDPNASAYVQQIGAFVNDAGYDYDALDIEELLKKPRDLSSYDGIVTAYLSSQMIGADLYHRFLVRQMEAGLPICIIGAYGAYQGLLPSRDGRLIQWNEGTADVNTFFYPFGLEFFFGFTNDGSKLRVTRKTRRFSEHETPLEPADLKYYQFFRSVYPANEVHLGVERTDIIDSESAFVVHTPFGGMILESYGFFFSTEQNKLVQRVDMAGFIKRAIARDVPEVPQDRIKTHAQLVKAHPLPRRPPPPEYPAPIPGEESRHVIALYKEKDASRLIDFPVHQRLGAVLDWFGLLVDYWPVDTKGLPPPEVMSRHRAILTWHTSPYLRGARRYGEWLLSQVRSGKKLLWFGDYGASIDSGTQERPELERELLRELGIERKTMAPPRFQHEPKLGFRDQMLGFEHTVDPVLFSWHARYRSVSAKNTVHFRMQDHNFGPIDLVVTGPGGGVALEDSAFYTPPDKEVRRIFSRKESLTVTSSTIQYEATADPYPGSWVVDPFAFVSRSLGIETLPAPDVTTVNGARVLYTHIDGDALDSVSLIDKAHLAGYLVKRHLLEKYPQIPHTASVISKLVEESGNEYYRPAAALAREILALPNVEAGSHAATHPFDWTKDDPFLANPGEYPFKIGYRPFDFVNELWGSRLFIEQNLAPRGKPCRMILWTGGTNPAENAMSIAWRAGLDNINSGDPILDKDNASVANLCPIGLKLGPYHKIHTSAQNDFLYSNCMMGDWGGQKKVLEHFERTGRPRRLSALNVYYHFYAGIKQESLDALRIVFDDVLEGIRAGSVAPLFASEYSRIAQDYYRTQLIPDGPDAWTIVNAGVLRTIRFPSTVHVDVLRSRGVLGYCHDQDQTYVHLDGTRARRIVLSNRPPRALHLRQATMIVDSARRAGDSLELAFRGLSVAVFTFAGARPGMTHRVTLADARGRVLHEREVAADARGIVRYGRELAPAPQRYTIRITEERGI